MSTTELTSKLALRDALGTAAHAFAGPVLTGRAAARSLLDRHPEDPDARALGAALGRAELLLDGLTRLHAAERPPWPEAVSLDRVLRAALRRVRAHGLHPDVRADPLGTVTADESHLTTMLAELLANVVHHAGPDARVTLRSQPAEDGVELTLTDTGPGLPEGVDRDRPIPFCAVGRTRGAAGCGLAVVSALATVNGGQMRLQDGEDGGTRVTLVLPPGEH